jgi:tRNA-specific 2-thiouridylase
VDAPPPSDQTVEVRIRHRHAGAAGRVEISPHGLVSVKLDEPARAVTPGQAAVVYDRDRVLGGGWIV